LQLNSDAIYLKLKVTKGARCAFSFGTNGADDVLMSSGFAARALRWVGAGIGLYCFSGPGQEASGVTGPTRRGGYADFEWFRVTYRESNM
jgi:hypothetical protein